MENIAKKTDSRDSFHISLVLAKQFINDYLASSKVIKNAENKIVHGYRFDSYDVLKTIFGMQHTPGIPDGKNDFGVYFGLNNEEITLIIIQFDIAGNPLTAQMHEFSRPEITAPFPL